MAASLRTSRLLLRPWRDGDIAAYGQLEADPAVMEYLLPRPDWAARARAHWEEHGFGQTPKMLLPVLSVGRNQKFGQKRHLAFR